MGEEADAIILPRTEDLVFWLFWLVSVIVLLLCDVWKAWKRRAPWIPGQALVLSAIIIELLSFIDYSHISVYSGSRYQTKEVVATLVKNHWVIDSGRLMMCVLIAYLLPGMARSGSITDGSNIAVLALSIASQVFSELRSFWSEGSDRIIYDVCSTILILAIIYLLVLLIRAVMSGRTICRIGSQKISSALLSFRPPLDRPSYNDIKNHVLKCWIVVRFTQPDYVLVRTGLCSMAFPVVTVCIGVHVIYWRNVQFTDNESLNSGTKKTLVQFVILGQCVIVLIGWIVLLVRWVASHMQGDTFRRDYFDSMSIEDAQIDLPASLIRLFVTDKRNQEKAIRDLDEKFRDINSLLWNPRLWVKKLFQKISIQNPPHWLTSTKEMLSGIKTTVIEKVKSKAVPDNSQFPIDDKTLKTLLIPGESASFLWITNQWGFRKLRRYIEQGEKDGKRSSRELIDLLALEKGTTEGEVGIPFEEIKAKHLHQANKKSWKRTAVSLIHFMIYFYDDSDDSVIVNAMQCYIQAWEYMNFADGLNEEVKSLGRQADKEFESLQHSWDKHAEPGMLWTKIKQPLDKVIHLSSVRLLRNSRDSKEVAKYCWFKTRKVFKKYLLDGEINKIRMLNRLLARVYYSYLTQDLNKAVIRKCSELAKEGMEEEILNVAFLSAKAQGLLDEVGGGPGGRTGEASPSSQIPPADKGKGKAELPPKDLIQSPNAAADKRKGIRSRRLHETAVDVAEDHSTDSDNEDDSTGPTKSKSQ